MIKSYFHKEIPSIKTFHLKLISNSSYYKEKFSLPITNKDYFLNNLISRKRKEKLENSKISRYDSIHKPKSKIKALFKNSNPYIKFRNFSKILRKSEESKKVIDTDLQLIIKNTPKKIVKYNSTNMIKQNNTEKFVLSKKFKTPLIITPLSKSNNNIIKKKNNGRNKINKFKKSFTTSNYKENDEILKNNFFSITPIEKFILFKSTKPNKVSEGTQINKDLFNENKFVNNKNKPLIHKKRFCSPKSIIFQKKVRKLSQ